MPFPGYLIVFPVRKVSRLQCFSSYIAFRTVEFFRLVACLLPDWSIQIAGVAAVCKERLWKNVCLWENTTQWPWRGALSRAWSSPPTVFSAYWGVEHRPFHDGVGKGESRNLTIWAQTGLLYLLVQDSPIFVFVYSVTVNRLLFSL